VLRYALAELLGLSRSHASGIEVLLDTFHCPSSAPVNGTVTYTFKLLHAVELRVALPGPTLTFDFPKRLTFGNFCHYLATHVLGCQAGDFFLQCDGRAPRMDSRVSSCDLTVFFARPYDFVLPLADRRAPVPYISMLARHNETWGSTRDRLGRLLHVSGHLIKATAPPERVLSPDDPVRLFWAMQLCLKVVTGSVWFRLPATEATFRINYTEPTTFASASTGLAARLQVSSSRVVLSFRGRRLTDADGLPLLGSSLRHPIDVTLHGFYVFGIGGERFKMSLPCETPITEAEQLIREITGMRIVHLALEGTNIGLPPGETLGESGRRFNVIGSD
jgi:hypothetical protein